MDYTAVMNGLSSVWQWLGDVTAGDLLLGFFSGLLVLVTHNLVRETKRMTIAGNNAVGMLNELANRIHQATQAQEKAAAAAERHSFTVQSEALRWATDSYFRFEDELRQAAKEIDEKKKRAAAERYFEHLWGLHQVQYMLRKLGSLPEQSYATWLVVRDYHFRNDPGVAGMSPREGLEHAKAWMLDDEFAAFVDGFIGTGKSHAEMKSYVEEWMKRHSS